MTIRHKQHWPKVFCLACLALYGQSAAAYLLFEGQPKWGDFTLGTGATVTWSLIPDGTDVLRTADLPSLPAGTNEFLFQDFWSGPSNLTSIYTQLDSNPANGALIFRSALTRAFATWAAVADLQFVEIVDSGLPMAHPDASGTNAGDIRIGAFPLTDPFDCCAGFGFEPPGGTNFRTTWNPTTTGDISLNNLAFFSHFPGLQDGDASGGFPNDIEGLLIHELGHALGLGHPEADGLSPGEELAIMYVGAGCCDALQRTLAADDIAGIQALYGPNPIPLPTSAWSFISGAIAISLLIRRRHDNRINS
ncbi:MAG: matrixin family metalloprotease [Methylomonas sp.]|nr:matrixin family metalloprotease [Methylomonas sp.]